MKPPFVAGLFVLLALAAVAAEIPRPAPEFPIPLADGRTIRTADFQGKVVVIEFLLTTCPGCQKAAGILERLRNEYAARGVEVVGVATNPGAEKEIGAFRQKSGAQFPIGHRPLEAALNYLQISPMSILKVPLLVFIDRHGVIRAQHGGDDQFFFLDEERNIRRQLLALLSEREVRPARRQKNR